MKQHKFLLPAAALIAIGAAACSPAPETAPVSTPTPSPVQTQAPAPIVQQPEYENYLDAPQTPGDWKYVGSDGASQATFRSSSEYHFAFTCLSSSRQISLMRQYDGSGSRIMRILTETGEKILTAKPIATQSDVLAANLSANDPFLDAMAITKGRIAVETEGMKTLYLPAWPELSRVIEDCR